MLAARLHREFDLRIEELPMPEPGEGEVLLKVKAVGICGSDVHYYAEGRIGDAVVAEPVIPGHEFSALVEKLGPGVSRVKVGDRVAVDPARSCGKCEFCLSGNPNLCPKVEFCGTPPVDGCLLQYMVYPEENLFPLPESIDFAEGAMLEPLGVAIHAVNLSKMKPADTVAVLGCGPIGLLTLQMARVAGASRTFATELLLPRLEMAEKFGATRVINVREEDPVRVIMEETGGRGVDVAFEAAGAQETPQQAAEIARPGGRVIVLGIPAEDVMVMQASTVRRKGLTIKLVRRMKHTYPRSIALVEGGMVDVRSLITHRFPLERTAEAMELVHNYRDGVIKALIEL
ncbi:MAG: NAD(P)-dependent alcohol dehydrogenase [Anaerolineae bacterium]